MLTDFSKFFANALHDIDGIASSKRLALMYLLLLIGAIYGGHIFYHTSLDSVDKLIDLAKVDLLAILGEHVPNALAAFKSGTSPEGQKNDTV